MSPVTLTRNPFLNVCAPSTFEDQEKVERFLQQVHEIRDAFTDHIIASGIIKGDENAVAWVDDPLFPRCIEWGYAGYLLGLAVGMPLGPEALNGGAR
jgi:hypothetical protein